MRGMAKGKQIQESEVVPGTFFEDTEGDIFFKTGPKSKAFITTRSAYSKLVHLDTEPLVDNEVTLTTLTDVRDLLKRKEV